MPRLSDAWRPNGLCSLFVCDIASFGDPERTDLDRHKIRTAFYDGLRKSFNDDGVPYKSCYSEDRGDGALVVVPPSIDTTILLTSLVERLRAEVRQHNDVSIATARMQLRVAVHTGVVHSDAKGLVGSSVNYAFRILEAEPLKQALLRSRADLALITSERVYDDVIRHGLGLVDPSEYHRVDLKVKETATSAWIRLPGLSAPVVVIPPSPRTISDPRVIVSAVPTAPDPPQLLAATATVTDRPSGLDALVNQALKIRQLPSRRVRDQIVGELPLALATAINTQRADDDWADMSAIVRICHEQPNGMNHLLRVIRQFVGDSTQLAELTRSIDGLRQA